MAVLLLVALVGLFAAMPDIAGGRDRFLRSTVLFGVALFISTEGLSVVQQLHRVALVAWWSAVIAGALIFRMRRGLKFRWSTPRVPRDPVTILCVGGCFVVLLLTGITAAFSAPNSADDLGYHMPRVIYWAEQGSVRFFPTPSFVQIMLQPFAEYLMLHTWVLSANDHYINFVQWFGFLGSIVGVSCIARKYGAAPRGQAIAALFCATLPTAIYACTGAKNDLFLAMWLVAAIYFALRFEAMYVGSAIGLALLTKAVAYLFAPWLLAAALYHVVSSGLLRKQDGSSISSGEARMRPLPRILLAVAMASGIAIGINTPHYIRNYEFSGSVLGYDSVWAGDLHRWRIEKPGWRATVSNGLRTFSEQLGTGSSRWNRAVYRFVLAAHRRLGIDPNDPATTDSQGTFQPPVDARHEGNGNNHWHLALLFLAMCVLAARSVGRRDTGRFLYAAGLVCGFIAFCALLKWQTFGARFVLPLYILGAPLAGIAAETGMLPVQLLVCIFLLYNAKPAVLDNRVRPLRGPRSVLHVSRDTQYLTEWGTLAWYTKAVRLVTDSKCGTVGIDIADYPIEYPLQVFLRERNPNVLFVHTGVNDASSRYRPPVDAMPCAVVCLNCARDEKRRALYGSFGSGTEAGRFVVFTRGAQEPVRK